MVDVMTIVIFFVTILVGVATIGVDCNNFDHATSPEHELLPTSDPITSN